MRLHEGALDLSRHLYNVLEGVGVRAISEKGHFVWALVEW